MYHRIVALLTGRPVRPAWPGDRGRRRVQTFRQIREAERFLDRLENHAVGGLGFAVASKATFVVRYRA